MGRFFEIKNLNAVLASGFSKKAVSIIVLFFMIPLLTLFTSCSEKSSRDLTSTKYMNRAEVTVGSVRVEVDVARTSAQREKGLSGRQQLGEKEGMLFIHQRSGCYSYWMGGMKFPLDFIFINNGRVVEVKRNVQPPKKEGETLSIVSPSKEFEMVLEVNAGFVDKYGIKTGDPVRVYHR